MMIYKATHLPTGKIYVGSCVRDILEHRINQYYGHMRSDVKNNRPLSPFRKALFIEPREAFKWEVLEAGIQDKVDLLKQDAYWTDKLHANDPDVGFNKRTGTGNMTYKNKRDSWQVPGAKADNPRLAHLVH